MMSAKAAKTAKPRRREAEREGAEGSFPIHYLVYAYRIAGEHLSTRYPTPIRHLSDTYPTSIHPDGLSDVIPSGRPIAGSAG
jgi:hypothetical protein